MRIKLTSFLAIFAAFAMSAQSAADSAAITSMRWVTDTVAPGVVLKIGHFEDLYGEPQNVVCFEINRNERKLAIGVNAPVEKTNLSGKDFKALAAVNGSFFDMRRGNSVCYLRQNGRILDTTTSGSDNFNGALVIDDGALSLMRWNKDVENNFEHTSPSSDALVSGPMLVESGEYSEIPNVDKSFSTTHHPRTGVGVRADGTVLLVTADGRQPDFAGGMSLPCFAHLLKSLGAVDAMNLDGGGSTTAWASHLPYGGVVNRPSGKLLRRVANIVYAY